MQTGARKRDSKLSEIKRARCRIKRLNEKRSAALRQLLVIEKELGQAVRHYDNLAEYMGWAK
jgi:hypothetical protein